MKIASSLFEAFLKCPTKCYLRSVGETGSGNEYAAWVRAQDESYERDEVQRLQDSVPETERVVAPLATEKLKAAQWRLAENFVAQAPYRSADGHVRASKPGDIEAGGQGFPRSECVLESRLHAVERIPSEGRGRPAQFLPIRCIFRNKLTKDDKLLLAFDAFVLSQAVGREVSLGKIIHGDVRSRPGESTAEKSTSGSTGYQPVPSGNLPDGTARTSATEPDAGFASNPSPIPVGESPTGTGESPVPPLTKGGVGSAADCQPEAEAAKTGEIPAALLGAQLQPQVLRVKTSALVGEVRKRIEKISALLSSPTPPDLVLNRHCPECEYRDRCRKIAIEKDDLSLLAGMSAKERQKLRSKGIFTVTQLSYTFRARRRPKRLRERQEKYHHSLKALAIREKKIHIVGSPELKIEGTPVYLDVEGLPDRDFYYLIGLR
ncbi:MAG: hypothetical protein HY735_16575, partial [Verrucomicrobia bacterium]|nr:hypothetical protein [Verrucomicrobiota bacterium]